MSESTKALPWREEEIVRHYRTAKNPAEMIMILAELNGTTANRIRQVLRRAGLEPVRREPSDRQKAHMKVMLEREDVRYTVDEVARMHRLEPTTVRAKYRGKEWLVLDGEEYKVIGYRRRG